MKSKPKATTQWARWDDVEDTWVVCRFRGNVPPSRDAVRVRITPVKPHKRKATP